MADMKHPLLGSTVTVRDDAVKRYTEAGYTEVKSSSKSGDTAKSSTSKRTTRKKS